MAARGSAAANPPPRTRRPTTTTDTEYDNGGDDTGHDAPIITTTTRRAKAGTWAFAGFVDVGHRWLEDTPSYTDIVVGVSVRLAALAELVTIGAR